MATCDYCGTTILFGGKTWEGLRFCNERCQHAGVLLAVSHQAPDHLVQQRLWEVHQGACPKCQGPGPVDAHMSYRVWSAGVLTSWSSRPHVGCRSCGRKSQLTDVAFSVLLGWWGFPWGFIITPVQIVRNLAGVFRSADSSKPSAQLEKLVRIELAGYLLNQARVPDA